MLKDSVGFAQVGNIGRSGYGDRIGTGAGPYAGDAVV
jgi:hypothetical protein